MASAPFVLDNFKANCNEDTIRKTFVLTRRLTLEPDVSEGSLTYPVDDEGRSLMDLSAS